MTVRNEEKETCLMYNMDKSKLVVRFVREYMYKYHNNAMVRTHTYEVIIKCVGTYHVYKRRGRERRNHFGIELTQDTEASSISNY
jgi:hypothetical protein